MRLCVKTLIVALLLGLVVADAATAQRRRREKRKEARTGEAENQPVDPGAADEANLVATLEMFVYPAGEQSAEQQEADELECTAWARAQVAEMPEASAAPEEEAEEDRRGRRTGDRSGLKGAAKGAVVGAALEDDEPELPKSRDDVGDNVKGDRDDISPPESRDEVGDNVKRATKDDGPSTTEVGAAVGLVAGRRRGKKAAAEAEAQAAEAELESAEQAEMENLRKALKVCLEAKSYKVE